MGSYSSLWCVAFLLKWLLFSLRSTGSRHTGFTSCGTWGLLPLGMRDLPRPGMEPGSPALAGGFLSCPTREAPDYFLSINSSVGGQGVTWAWTLNSLPICVHGTVLTVAILSLGIWTRQYVHCSQTCQNSIQARRLRGLLCWVAAGCPSVQPDSLSTVSSGFTRSLDSDSHPGRLWPALIWYSMSPGCKSQGPRSD